MASTLRELRGREGSEQRKDRIHLRFSEGPSGCWIEDRQGWKGEVVKSRPGGSSAQGGSSVGSEKGQILWVDTGSRTERICW